MRVHTTDDAPYQQQDITADITLIFSTSKAEDILNAEAMKASFPHVRRAPVPEYMAYFPSKHQRVDSAGQVPPPFQLKPIVGTAVSSYWPYVNWVHFEAAALLINPEPTVSLEGVVVVLICDQDDDSRSGFDLELIELERRGAAAVLINSRINEIIGAPMRQFNATIPVYSIDKESSLWMQRVMTHKSAQDHQFRVDIKHKAHSTQNNGGHSCSDHTLNEELGFDAAIHGGVRHGFWKRGWAALDDDAACLVFTCTASQAEIRWLEHASTELNSSAIPVQNGINGFLTAHPHAGLTLSPNDGQYCIVNPRRNVVQRLSLQCSSGGGGGGGGAAAAGGATPEEAVARAGVPAPEPVMETFAGKVDESGNVDACDGASARFSSPTGIATLPDGTFVVVDQGNNTIRTVAAWPGDEVRTLVCTAAGPLGPDPAGEQATFEKLGTTGIQSQNSHNPAIAADHHGNVAVVDGGCVRIISGLGLHERADDGIIITTIAGERSVRGIVDGPAATARFLSVRSISALPGGGWLLCDGNVVRKISADHAMVSTVAGSANEEHICSKDGINGVDGIGHLARFNCPQAVAVDSAGHALVADGTLQHEVELAAHLINMPVCVPHLLCAADCVCMFAMRCSFFAGTASARTAINSMKALLSLRKIDLASGQVTTLQLIHIGYDKEDDGDGCWGGERGMKMKQDDCNLRKGTVHDMVIDTKGDVLLSTNNSFCGGSMIPNQLRGQLFSVRNTGVAPGYHPWKSIPKWSPTRQCHRTSPARTQVVVWTTLLIAAHFTQRIDSTLEDDVASSLPLLPIEMWHAIVGSYRAYELALL